MQKQLRLENINKTQASDHLNVVRGLAAIAVLLGHVRALFFANYFSFPHHSLPIRISYFWSGLGHEAVMVFFVLSGYFIGSAVLRSALSVWSWSNYLNQRLARLFVVLLPALCLGAMWDSAGIVAFGDTGIYGGHAATDGVIPWSVPARLGLKIALGNASFLQGILVPTFGSNGPLWSLSYEFWYYILFPVVVLALIRIVHKSISSIVYVSFLCILLLFVTPPILYDFPIWLLGVLVAILVPHIRGNQRALLGFAMIASLIALCLSRFHYLDGLSADYAVGLAFAALLLALLTFRRPGRVSGYSSFAQILAGFSYSLYLVHLPFLVFMRALLIKTSERWNPDFRHSLLFCLISGMSMLYAYGVASLTEFRTQAVRDWVVSLAKRLNGEKAQANA